MVFSDIEPESLENKIYSGLHRDFKEHPVRMGWQWLVKPLNLFALCFLNTFIETRRGFVCITIVDTPAF